MKKLKYIIPAVLMAFGFASCENMDELYKDYQIDVTHYSTKISGLGSISGYERAILNWTNPKDQVAKGIRVSYGEGVDEKTLEFNELISECEVTGLTATAYEFRVSTLDSHGNPSIPVSRTVSVFTSGALSAMDLPAFTAVADDAGTYTVVVKNVSSPMSMFGGSLKVTLKNEAGASITLPEYTETVNYADKRTKFLEKKFEGVALSEGAWTAEYTIVVHPTNFRDKTTDGWLRYTSVCIDTVPVSGSASFTAGPANEPVVGEEE